MRKHWVKLGFLAFGLSSALFVTSSVQGTDRKDVTFSKDVAPIIFNKCASCHRPGEGAPMELLSYKQVRPWAKSIRQVVVDRQMPPWFADPAHGDFLNDRRLTESEIATISSWVDTGAKEGNPAELPKLPAFPEAGWTIGKPDVILSMTEEFAVPDAGVVPYKYFAIPTNFTEDKYVQMAQIRRGEPSVIHHVIVTVQEPNELGVASGEIRNGERLDPEAATRNSAANRRNADGMLVGWAPGMSPLILKPGQAKLVKKGSTLVFQMHYTTTGVAAKDRTSVGLVFAKSPIEKRVITAGASARALVIPAGDPNYKSTSSFTFREDSHIVSFMPHMHLRGKDFEYKLVYPDGTSKVLLSVPKYDFNWQLSYFLKQPVAAPKGSRLECVAHHDNSDKNKFNPDPSKEVRWGPQTWEEMMIGWFDYTLDDQDLRKVTATASK